MMVLMPVVMLMPVLMLALVLILMLMLMLMLIFLPSFHIDSGSAPGSGHASSAKLQSSGQSCGSLRRIMSWAAHAGSRCDVSHSSSSGDLFYSATLEAPFCIPLFEALCLFRVRYLLKKRRTRQWLNLEVARCGAAVRLIIAKPIVLLYIDVATAAAAAATSFTNSNNVLTKTNTTMLRTKGGSAW